MRLIPLLILSLLTPLLGCSTHYKDLNTDQPWCGPNQRAEMDIAIRDTYLGPVVHPTWSEGRRSWDAWECSGRANRAYMLATGMHTLGTTVPGEYLWRYEDTKTIVCVDPLVLVVVPMPYVGGPPNGDPRQADWRKRPPENGLLTKQGIVRLALWYGFIYGTSVPYHPDATFIYADSAAGAHRIADEPAAPTEWGELRFTVHNDRIHVTALGPSTTPELP